MCMRSGCNLIEGKFIVCTIPQTLTKKKKKAERQTEQQRREENIWLPVTFSWFYIFVWG